MRALSLVVGDDEMISAVLAFGIGVVLYTCNASHQAILLAHARWRHRQRTHAGRFFGVHVRA